MGDDDADILRRECSAKARARKGKKGGGADSSGGESDGGRGGKGGGKRKGKGVCWKDQQQGGCNVQGCTFRRPSKGE